MRDVVINTQLLAREDKEDLREEGQMMAMCVRMCVYVRVYVCACVRARAYVRARRENESLPLVRLTRINNKKKKEKDKNMQQWKIENIMIIERYLFRRTRVAID